MHLFEDTPLLTGLISRSARTPGNTEKG